MAAGEDALLWLAAENEFLRRTVRNDRETIAHLRSQLRTAKRALRTLHAQGVGADRSEQHRCLLFRMNSAITLHYSNSHDSGKQICS
jgi:hypothetical protein